MKNLSGWTVRLLTLTLSGGLAFAGGDSRDPSGGRGPMLRKAIGPVYPAAALPFAPDSTLIAGVRVAEDGTVEGVRVLHAKHPGLGFEDAAIAAVQQWRFRPARSGGKKVSSFEVVELQFRSPTRGSVIPDYHALAHATLAETPAARASTLPDVDRWPICGSRHCLMPTGEAWMMSWRLPREQFLIWLLQNRPELRSGYVSSCSTLARVPYEVEFIEADIATINEGGFVYRSWDRYTHGLDSLPRANGGGVESASTQALAYPQAASDRVRKLVRDNDGTETAEVRVAAARRSVGTDRDIVGRNTTTVGASNGLRATSTRGTTSYPRATTTHTTPRRTTMTRTTTTRRVSKPTSGRTSTGRRSTGNKTPRKRR